MLESNRALISNHFSSKVEQERKRLGFEMMSPLKIHISAVSYTAFIPFTLLYLFSLG